MNTTALPYQADRGTLSRASVAAVVAATMVLVLFVLPAEYGIDPTGAGRVLGLSAMNGSDEAAEELVPAPTNAPAAPISEQT